MDLYLLVLTAKVLGKTATYPRIFLGSAVGATGYCLILCLPGMTYMQKVLFGMVPVGSLMVKTGCRTNGARELFRGMGYLYTFSFLLGGFMVFLKGHIPFSLTAVAGAGFVGLAVCQRAIDRYQKRKQNHFCRVLIEGDNGQVALTALIDTGNGLVEPISQKPVAILSKEEWEHFRLWMKPERFKLIPYHSIGNQGMLEGYEVDAIEVESELGKKRFEKVIIAVVKGKVSEKGGYQMILPPEFAI